MVSGIGLGDWGNGGTGCWPGSIGIEKSSSSVGLGRRSDAHIVLKDSQSFAVGHPSSVDPSPLKKVYGTSQPP